MKAFLTEQIAKIEEELKQLFIDRARSGIETEGSYDIMIDRKKKELHKLNNEINDLGNNQNPEIKSDKISPTIEIKTLIANGKIEEAIKKLMDSSGDDQLILLSARYNRIKKQNNSGTINHANFSIELNKITNSLLSILNDL